MEIWKSTQAGSAGSAGYANPSQELIVPSGRLVSKAQRQETYNSHYSIYCVQK